MTADRDFDRQLGSWFDERATASAPDRLLERALARVDATGQRPGWLVRDRGRPSRAAGRPGLTRARAGQLFVVTVAVIVVAAGAGLLLRHAPAAIGGPSGAPSIAPVPSTTAAPAASPTASATPATTPRPAAVIAYIRYVENRVASIAPTGRVWIAGADGSGGHELFPGGIGEQSGAAWSPDGTRLVYSERNPVNAADTWTHLFLTDANGSAPQAVDPSCATSCYENSPSFSSDGTRLLFLRGDGSLGTPRLEILDIASGRVVELTSPSSTPVAVGERPRWSPDGTKILFSRLDKFGIGSAVFVVDADGTNLHQLSTASLPARLPDWSPEGSRIVFTSLVVTYVKQGGDTVMKLSQDVYTVRPDWTDLRRLTKDGISIGATWTPDGRILFARGSSCQVGCTGSDTGGFWVMNADGSGARLLVPGGSGLNAPYWGIDAAWQPTP